MDARDGEFVRSPGGVWAMLRGQGRRFFDVVV